MLAADGWVLAESRLSVIPKLLVLVARRSATKPASPTSEF
jgi:hypothetical protein